MLATGRAWLDALPVVTALGLPSGPVVCSNGAVVVNHPPLHLRDITTFDPAPVISRVAELAPHTLIAVEEIGVGFRVNRLFPMGDLTGTLRIESLAELAARPAARVIIHDPNGCEADFLTLADQLGLHGVSYAVGWSAWLDIAPLGVNKSTALQGICDDWGIRSSDVLAIGDGRNDIDMLTWAGRGVAMGDAPWEVRQAADDVAANFEDDGLATELNRWFGFGVQTVLPKSA